MSKLRLGVVMVAAALVTLTMVAGGLPAASRAAASRAAAVTGTAAVTVAAEVGSAPPAPLVSNYETATGNSLDRDCGWSRPLPGSTTQSFWLFCDTAIDSTPGTLLCAECFVAGSTAAEGPFSAGLVPDTLSELPTPPATPALPDSNEPEHFLANPSAASLNCTASGDYAARWASGVVQEPSSAHSGDFLISYTKVCVEGSTGTILTDGFGVVEYNPSTNALGTYHDVFTGQNLEASEPQWLLGTPVLGSDGYLYLYSAACADPGLTCQGGGNVFLARVPASPSDWGTSADYTFYTGTSASGSPQWGGYASAVSDVPSAAPAGASGWTADNYAAYPATGHQYVAVEETSIGGDYQVWSASSPAGPWTVIQSGRLCAAGDGCHALIGHPELSTSADLLVSYYSSDAHHIEVAAVPW
jgi:hypothetical protein